MRLYTYIIAFAMYFIAMCDKSNLDILAKAFCDENSCGIAIQRIESIKGRIPDDDDYFSLCADSSLLLEPQERADIWGKLVSLQKPEINRTELLRIYEARRSSIFDGRLSYIVKSNQNPLIDNFDNNDSECANQLSYIFAFKKNKFFLERLGKRWPSDSTRLITSFDGEQMIFVRYFDSEMLSSTITRQISMKFFYEPYMPLLSAGLFDERRVEGTEWVDLVEFLQYEGRTHVFQQEKAINSRKCIAVLDAVTRWHLDKTLDYSVVRIEQFAHKFDPKNEKRLVGRELIYRFDMFDHNSENGVWIPQKTTYTVYKDGKATNAVDITVANMQINQGMPDSFFTNVIPDNAYVVDENRRLIYRQSDSPSISSLLKETTKSKRLLVYRYISIGVGLALIFGALAIKYHEYLKNKNTT